MLLQIQHLILGLLVCPERHQEVVCCRLLAQSFLKAVDEIFSILIKGFVARCVFDIPIQRHV